MKLYFDTETSGFAENRLVQLAAVLVNDERDEVAAIKFLVRPKGFTIEEGATNVHGITQEKAVLDGFPLPHVLVSFMHLAAKAKVLLAWNYQFDERVVDGEINRTFADRRDFLKNFAILDPMLQAMDICKLPKTTSRGSDLYKWPKLTEAFEIFFPGEPFPDAHDAFGDVRAMIRVHQAIEDRRVEEARS